MHIPDDIRKSIIFVGFNADEHFRAIGSAFLMTYADGVYIVTARHVAMAFGEDPFFIRLNTVAGGCTTIPVDPTPATGFRWYYHPDDNVDLAVLPYHYKIDRRQFDHMQLTARILAGPSFLREWGIGPGEMCYVIGLFRLMAGKKRNLAIVHSGNIAAMPGDELIPVADWLETSASPKTRYVEGFLVEISSLTGLSGAPVIVRPNIRVEGHTVMGEHSVAAYSQSIFLLGVWQGAWDAKPNEVMSVEKGMDVRVSVGMGVVVPAAKIVELLGTTEVTEERTKALAEINAKLAGGMTVEDYFFTI
jgi:hypothetical protein